MCIIYSLPVKMGLVETGCCYFLQLSGVAIVSQKYSNSFCSLK